MRIAVLRRTAMKESYHHADHTIIAELGLHGRFYQVPDWLYFRREHPGQSGQATMRSRCATMDPHRANRFRHPAIRLYGEYVWGYISAIQRAPLSFAERRECFRYLAQWFASRARPGYAGPADPVSVDPLPAILIDSVVARGRVKGGMAVNDAHAGAFTSENIAESHKRDFWINENKKHIPAHYRLQKCGRIINAVAAGEESDLLDVGCGPATLMRVLERNIHYYGIDIAIQEPAPNLLEADILTAPIMFGDKSFDIVVAQGLFEYMGEQQSQKFSEIAQILRKDGKFVVTYTNFNHRAAHIFKAFSNVQPLEEFRSDLARFFTIDKYFPASHNWYGGQPTRKLVMAANMHFNANVPVISPKLAVEYFFVCSRR